MPIQTTPSASEGASHPRGMPAITIDPDFHIPPPRERGSFLRALRRLFLRTP